MDWIGNIFICLGLWFIGNKVWYAFVFSIIGEVLWIIHSLQKELYSLAFITTIFAIIAIRNLILWKTEKSNNATNTI